MRDELSLFAMAMETKLKRHDKDRGDSWKDCDKSFLRGRLIDEVTEYLDSYPCDRKELVDIANFCMMLWYRDIDKTKC